MPKGRKPPKNHLTVGCGSEDQLSSITIRVPKAERSWVYEGLSAPSICFFFDPNGDFRLTRAIDKGTTPHLNIGCPKRNILRVDRSESNFQRGAHGERPGERSAQACAVRSKTKKRKKSLALAKFGPTIVQMQPFEERNKPFPTAEAGERRHQAGCNAASCAAAKLHSPTRGMALWAPCDFLGRGPMAVAEGEGIPSAQRGWQVLLVLCRLP